MKSFTVGINDCGQRLDNFIKKVVPNLPKNLLYKYIRLKRIKINGKKSELAYRLCQGDVLELYINDEFFEVTRKNVINENLGDIDVVYEDENILLINKPRGLVVHEDSQNSQDTLIARALLYLYRSGAYDPSNELSFTPALCNRIDRNTCGIVILAKNAKSLKVMNEVIKNREISKKYLCICVGNFSEKAATLKHYHIKDETNNKVKIYDKQIKDSKTIITKYEVLRTKNNLSLVEVDLITGRTHQIRAHMAYIGHPVLGDGKYGINSENKYFKIYHQALCSYKLKFEFISENELSYLNGKEFTVKDIWFSKIMLK